MSSSLIHLKDDPNERADDEVSQLPGTLTATNNMVCSVYASGTPDIFCVGGSNFVSQLGTDAFSPRPCC